MWGILKNRAKSALSRVRRATPIPTVGEKDGISETQTSRCRGQNVPHGHIIPWLPSLSFPDSLLKQPTPVPWLALCSRPWGAKTEFDPQHPQGKTLPTSGCSGAFLSLHLRRGPTASAGTASSAPASSILQASKSSSGKKPDSRHCPWVHLHRGKGTLCPSTTPSENKAALCFHLQ